MSQTKYKLPDDVKSTCVALVRGYKRRAKKYCEGRNAILYGSPPPLDGLPKNNYKSDPTVSKVIQLEKLDKEFDSRAIKAVDQAKLLIGVDFESEEYRQKLTIAIWDSCILGRNFHIEYYDLPMESNNFYERRRKFLWNIAKNMGFL